MALLQACKGGDVEKVKELLTKDAPLKNLADCLEWAVDYKRRYVYTYVLGYRGISYSATFSEKKNIVTSQKLINVKSQEVLTN